MVAVVATTHNGGKIMSEMINKEIDVSMLKRLVEERSEISNYMITGTLKGIDASRLIFTNCCYQDCSIMGCFFEKTVFFLAFSAADRQLLVQDRLPA